MKAHEAKECSACGKPPLQSGVGGQRAVTFYRLTTERFVLDQQAARSTLGIAMHFGGFDDPGAGMLADMFSPDPDVFKTDPELRDELIVCDNCAYSRPVAELLELFNRRKERAADDEEVMS